MSFRWIAFSTVIVVVGCMGTAQAEVGDFFPLEVGNRWVFQLYDVRYSETFQLEETISMEVTGQVQLKEHSYFVVQKDLECVFARRSDDLLAKRRIAGVLLHRAAGYRGVWYFSTGPGSPGPFPFRSQSAGLAAV